MGKPTDGGRGREWRTEHGRLRLFSARHGAASRRGRRWFVSARWTVICTDFVLLGASTFRDDDADRVVEIGLGPLLHVSISAQNWPRPEASR